MIKNRIFSLLLICSMLCGLLMAFPAVTFAASTGSGQCGPNVYWNLTSDGVLTLSGSGGMYAYTDLEEIPWASRYASKDMRSYVKTLVVGNGITSIAPYSFYYCKNLSKATLGTGLKTIGEMSFHSTENLLRVDLPYGLTSIGFCAFAGSGIYQISIPDSVTSMGYGIFNGCSNIIDAWVGKGMTYLPDDLFSSCSKLEYVQMTDYITSIGKNCFRSDSSLVTVIMSASVESIGQYAFSRCSKLQTMTLPSCLERVESYAFQYCSALSLSVNLDNPSYIGAYAFNNTAITSLELNGNSLTSLPDSAFSFCKKLKTITLPESLTELKYYAFGSCESVKEVTLPASLTTIGNSVFSSCYALTDVYYRGGISDWSKISIGSSNTNLTKATIHYLGEKYAVIYNANGGTNAPEAQSKIHQTALKLTTAVPSRTGYSFSSWNTKSDGTGTGYNSGATYSVDEAVTLYAQWTINKYYVKFNANGGSGTMSNQTHTYNSSLALKNCTFTRAGYTFEGWAKTADGNVVYSNKETVTNLSTENGATISLYAVWKANSYNVGFVDSSSSAVIDSASKVHGSSYGTLPIPTRTGYTFDGWYTSETGGTKVTSSTTVDITSDTTLYARWIANKYIVTLDYNDGSGTTEQIDVTYDSTFGILPAPKRAEYVFKGWFTEVDGGTPVTADTLVDFTENQTIYAKWALAPYIDTYSIKYKPFTLINVDFYNFDEECEVIMAAYKSGVLVDAQQIKYNGEESIPFLVYEDYDSVKVMVWKSLESMIPVCEYK